MVKKEKQLCLEACAIKERHPVASKTESVRQFLDVVETFSGIYNILALLDNNQSIERKPSS